MTHGYLIPLSAENLLAEARRQTDVDIYDEAALEPLTVLRNSMSEEGGLHEAGAHAQQEKLLRLLRNRLRMMRDFQTHPEIAEQKIERPLIIHGFARSGTTKTHKALAASGDFNYFTFWQAFNPSLHSGDPQEAPTPRIEEAVAYCEYFDRMAPDLKKGHPFEPHEPEEDTVLTEHCFVAPSFVAYATIPTYMEWLAEQSPLILFEHLRDTLKYMQWQGLATPGKRWLLKAPTYYGLEEPLLQVFPDADIVMTHRSPISTVGSTCKLIHEFFKPFSNASPDLDALCAGFKQMMELHIANRARLTDMRIFDIHFDDVTKNFPASLEGLYNYIEMPLNPKTKERIVAWDAGNPQHKHGKFVYDLASYALDEDTVLRDHTAYLGLMRELFGDR